MHGIALLIYMHALTLALQWVAVWQSDVLLCTKLQCGHFHTMRAHQIIELTYINPVE